MIVIVYVLVFYYVLSMAYMIFRGISSAVSGAKQLYKKEPKKQSRIPIAKSLEREKAQAFQEPLYTPYRAKTASHKRKRTKPTARQEAYGEYLKSPEWKAIRAERLEFDHYKCQLCSAKENLQVHHNNYPANWFDTKLNDLITLCDRCHKRHHSAFRH